jgi:acetyl-CoA carboxylase biotin carboxyl carrier protein
VDRAQYAKATKRSKFEFSGVNQMCQRTEHSAHIAIASIFPWLVRGESAFISGAAEATEVATNITAHITGTVWKIEKQVGDAIAQGDAVVIIESMKMEMPVESPTAGRVAELRCAEGQAVEEGAVLAVVE